MTIELTDREVELIRDLIARRIDEIGPEIHHTDSRTYRRGLVEQQEILESIQDRMVKPLVEAD